MCVCTYLADYLPQNIPAGQIKLKYQGDALQWMYCSDYDFFFIYKRLTFWELRSGALTVHIDCTLSVAFMITNDALMQIS